MGKQSKRTKPQQQPPPKAQTQVDDKQPKQGEPEVTDFQLTDGGRGVHESWVQNACQGEDLCNRKVARMITKKINEDGLGYDDNKDMYQEEVRIKKLFNKYRFDMRHEIAREFTIVHRDILVKMAGMVTRILDENPVEKMKADEARKMEAEIAAEIQRQASLVQPSSSVNDQDASSSEAIENVVSAEPPVLVEEETVDSEEDEDEKPDCNCMARNKAHGFAIFGDRSTSYSCYKCNSSDADIDPRTYADAENVEIQHQASQQQAAAVEPIDEVESTCAVQPIEELSVAEQLKRCSIAMNEAIEDMAKATNLDDF